MSERIEKIKDAVQVMHKCTAKHIQSVPVREEFGDKTVWEGVVEVFNIIGHPGIARCYAWSFDDGTETRFVTVLKIPPVMDAKTAVRAYIMGSLKEDEEKTSDPH